MPNQIDYLSEKYQLQSNIEVDKRLFELTSLFEISQILNSSLELKQVLTNMLFIPMGRLMITKGIILLKENSDFIIKIAKGVSEKLTLDKFTSEEVVTDSYFLPKVHRFPKRAKKYVDFMSTHNFSISIPLITQGKVAGLLLFGSKLNKKGFTEEELNFLESLANISTPAIENAAKVQEIIGINKELDQRIQQLKTLFDIAQGLSATLDTNKIEKLLTYALMGQMLVNHYVILIKENLNSVRIESKGFNKEPMENLLDDLSQFSNLESAQLISDFTDSKLKNRFSRLGARIFIPMRHQNKMLGLILLGDKINKQPYTPIDLEFLSTLVSQAVVSLENARLFKEALEKQKIEQELQVATNIQKKLLPREIPDIPGFDVWGKNIPSKEVGGDYFDIIKIDEHNFALTVADVSGKSVPASLLMANLQAALRIIIKEQMPLNQMVVKLNDLIYHNTDLDRYITLFVGILNSYTNEMDYVNAGHNPPLVISENGEVQFLEEGGIILGMLPEYPYSMGKITFKSNDLLLCYTDGINEALNMKDEEFGEERLTAYAVENRKKTTKQLVESLISEIKIFSKGVEQSDDITLLLAKKYKN
jgi:sigma-B regulation protein RsbU (phosphoserine phosphatase)